MAVSDFSGPAPCDTYHGFAGPKHTVSAGEKRRRTIALIGVGAALAMGLAVGMLAKPQVDIRRETPMEPVVQTASTGPQLAIQVDRSAPAPIAPAPRTEKLEVLPVQLAKAAPKPLPAARAQPVEYVEEEQALAPIDCAAPANGHEARICDEAFDESAPASTQLGGPEDY